MEFYANAEGSETNQVMVRGKVIKFHPTVINRFYSLPDVQEVEPLHSTHPEHIIQALAHEGATWKLDQSGMPLLFKGSLLLPVARLWQYFIWSRIHPSTHYSEVDIKRSRTLFAVFDSRPINVGQLINAEIKYCIRHPNSNYYFPHLITALCLQAGVDVAADEMQLPPLPTLTPTFLEKLERKNLAPPRAASPSAHAPAASSSAPVSFHDLPLAKKVDTVYEEVQSMKAQQTTFIQQQTSFMQHQTAYMDQMTTWFNNMASFHRDIAVNHYGLSRQIGGANGIDTAEFYVPQEEPPPFYFQPPSQPPPAPDA